MEPYVWGDAQVTFPDWVGTAQLDQKMTGSVDLYDLTGVDPDEWLIIGLEFGGGESGMHDPHVIAVRKSELYGRHISEMSSVTAADIQIHDADPFELLRQIIHLMDMRFRIRAVQQATITVTELLDEPPQIEPTPGVATPEDMFGLADLMSVALNESNRLGLKAFPLGYNVTFEGSGQTGTGTSPSITYFVWRIDQHPQNHEGWEFSSPTEVEAHLAYLATLPRYRLDLTGDPDVEEQGGDDDRAFVTIIDSTTDKEFYVRVIDLETATSLYMRAEQPPGGRWQRDDGSHA